MALIDKLLKKADKLAYDIANEMRDTFCMHCWCTEYTGKPCNECIAYEEE